MSYQAMKRHGGNLNAPYKLIWRGCIPHGSKSMRFQKRQDNGNGKKISGCWKLWWVDGGSGRGRQDEKAEHRELFRAVKIFCRIPLVTFPIHFPQPAECTTLGVNSNVNHVLGAMMMCQWRFISCNKCTTLVVDVENGGGCAWVGAEGTWEVFITSSQFCCKLQAAEEKSSKKTISLKFSSTVTLATFQVLHNHM